MLAFIRLPVPPASNTNPTSPMSGVTKSPSPVAARNFVIGGDWFVDTNAEAKIEFIAKVNDKRNMNKVVDFIVEE